MENNDKEEKVYKTTTYQRNANKAYAERNPEKLKELAQEYYANNKEIIIERQKTYYRENKERLNKRRAELFREQYKKPEEKQKRLDRKAETKILKALNTIREHANTDNKEFITTELRGLGV
jgi:hypothetical protein